MIVEQLCNVGPEDRISCVEVNWIKCLKNRKLLCLGHLERIKWVPDLVNVDTEVAGSLARL